MAEDNPPLVDMRGVGRAYPPSTVALQDVDIRLHAGETVAIVGPSGSGKSTLLSLLGLLDKPTSGSYLLSGVNVATLTKKERTLVRGSQIGFVFQSFHLIPHLTALENVQLGLVLGQRHQGQQDSEALSALERVDLGHRVQALPGTMSGGEQQRVAIARAAVRRPKLLLCDEPTGNLDSATATSILNLLFETRQANGVLVLVTHDPGVAKRCDRILTILDGALTEPAITEVH